MKKVSTKTIGLLLLSVILFVAGQVFFVDVFEFLEPKVDGIIFQITEQNATIKTSLLFSTALALIPALIVSTWQFGRIQAASKKMAVAVVVLTSIGICIFVRHQEVRIYFNAVIKPALLTNGRSLIRYPIDPVHFVYYIFAGLLMGCMIALMLFKRRKPAIRHEKTTG